MTVDRNKRCLPHLNLLGVGILSLCGIAAAAPGGSDSESAPFKLGEVQVINPVESRTADLLPPRIEILKPTRDERLRFGRPFKILVELTIPVGGKLPTFVVVGVKGTDGTYLRTRNALPKKESQGGLYTLEAEMNNLKGSAGEYEIEAEVIYVYMKKLEDGSWVEEKTTRLFKRIARHFDVGEST